MIESNTERPASLEDVQRIVSHWTLNTALAATALAYQKDHLRLLFSTGIILTAETTAELSRNDL